jgi:quercetin dioxygenase-like cupin family protein
VFDEDLEPVSAGVVIGCDDLAPTLTFYTEVLGFRVQTIHPADGPTHATLIGHGLRIHLQPGSTPLAVLRILLPHGSPLLHSTLTAPNGTIIECVSSTKEMNVPPLVSDLVVTHQDGTDAWGTGRAGMMYRDLIPGRQGNSVIASSIRIEQAGPVPDYVHFHEVLFQLIFCRSGWVRVLYEDQGDSFVLGPGDCVIQPPTIRHRVLESSDNLEVLEIGYPAEHFTHADPLTQLPTSSVNPLRTWSGQSFIRHTSSQATWAPFGEQAQITDTNIHQATQGLADVRIIKSESAASWPHTFVAEKQLTFLFVLQGSATVITNENGSHALNPGSSIVIPCGDSYTVKQNEGTEILRFNLQTE